MIIDRYIGRAILSGTLLALFIFGGLFAFLKFVAELPSVGINDYGTLQAIIFVLLNLPQLLYHVFPMSILLGTLLSLGALASSSELVVMRAAGISTARIIRSALQAGIVLAVILVLLGEFLAPAAISTAKTMRAEAIEGRVLTGDRKGLWSKYGNRFVFIGKVLPGVQLREVTVYGLDDQRNLVQGTYADQAHYEDEQWHLQDVSNSYLSDNRIITSENEKETWPAMVSTDLFNVLNLEPGDMSAMELYKYSRYLDQNELDSDTFWLAYWVKVFAPLAAIGMLLLAIPLVLTANHRSSSAGQRILIGVIIGVGFFVLNRVINNMGIIYGIMPVVSAAVPPLLVIIASMSLIRKIR